MTLSCEQTPYSHLAEEFGTPLYVYSKSALTEVRNEQAAITRLQTQLNAAKQKGDQIKIQQLTRTINARKANIRAIQGEMSR